MKATEKQQKKGGGLVSALDFGSKDQSWILPFVVTTSLNLQKAPAESHLVPGDSVLGFLQLWDG